MLFHNRNKFNFDESDDQVLFMSRQQSSDSDTTSPRILKRQSKIIPRTSSDIESEEQSTSWHNLPKDVWKNAAEVNNQNLAQ